MFTPPRISVIIPVYNASGTIMRLIASLQDQSLENFEAIIVNDGSTDNTASIVHKCVGMDNRFKIISTTNGGVSRARNIGIDNATARYCTFIDADDYLLPTALHTFFKDDDTPDGYMVCQSIFMEDMVSRQRSNLFLYDNDITVSQSQNTSFVSQSHFLSNGYCFAKLFDVSLLRQEGIRFDEKLRIHEDHLFCFEYLTKCKGIKIKRGGGYIYQIGNGSSLSFAIKPTYNLVTAGQRFLAYFLELFPAYNITENYRKTLLTDFVGSRILLEACNAYLAQRTHATAFTHKRYLVIRHRWRKDFKKYYTPPTKKAAILKFVFLHCPRIYHTIQIREYMH